MDNLRTYNFLKQLCEQHMFTIYERYKVFGSELNASYIWDLIDWDDHILIASLNLGSSELKGIVIETDLFTLKFLEGSGVIKIFNWRKFEDESELITPGYWTKMIITPKEK